MRKYVFAIVTDNVYDIDTAVDDIEVAYQWLRDGEDHIAMLDALSLEYCGYLDAEDLYFHDNYDEEVGDECYDI